MCASSTSRRWFRRRQSRMPALVRPDLSVVTATSLAILRPVAAARMARWSRYLLARPTLNPHANRCISTDRTVSTREIHILLHAQYLASTPPRLVLSLQTIVRGEQCTRGALLAPTKAEGSGGVVADIAKLSVEREEDYTRELATDHEQYLSGQGESPGRWYGAGASGLGWRAKHRWPGSRPCSRAVTPPRGNSWAAPMAATPCPPLTWSCGPPRACRSSTPWATQRPDGRSCKPITLGWPRRPATWTGSWGLAVAMAVSSTCSVRGCWLSGSTTGPPGRAIRCCTPIWSSPIGYKGRTDAGRPWTVGTCIGIGWPRTPSTGPPTSASLSGP